jgi:hypothetical protein
VPTHPYCRCATSLHPCGTHLRVAKPAESEKKNSGGNNEKSKMVWKIGGADARATRSGMMTGRSATCRPCKRAVSMNEAKLFTGPARVCSSSIVVSSTKVVAVSIRALCRFHVRRAVRSPDSAAPKFLTSMARSFVVASEEDESNSGWKYLNLTAPS